MSRPQNRAPGSFSPLTSNPSSSAAPTHASRPPPIKTNAPRSSFSSEDATTPTPTLSRPRSRNPASSPGLSPGLSPAAAGSTSRTASPSIYQSPAFAGSSSSVAGAARAHPSSPAAAAAIAARAGGGLTAGGPPTPSDGGGRGPTSPLATSSNNSVASASTTTSSKGHRRKHSKTQGHFEPILPSTSSSILEEPHPPPLHHHSASSNNAANPNPTALAAAAQAAMQHQSQQQHLRQRSQTVPTPGDNNLSPPYEQPQSQKPRGVSASGGKGPLSPPMLSLTEASAPRESGFGNQGYHNGLMGNHTAAATTAANVVFQRPNVGGGQPSPALTTQSSAPAQLIQDQREREREQPPPPPPPQLPPVKAKPEKSRKLFGRPGKINIKGDSKEKPQPSPSKIGAALSSLQRGNFSTTSLADISSSSQPSLYNLGNSSTATIRAVDSPIDGGGLGGMGGGGGGGGGGKEGKEAKEKKHHFLSRGKHKLSGKDSDYHAILSSSSSNSRPTDPHAPSLYNFNVPSSPGPTTTSFKSGLDLRHGGRKEKKAKDEKPDTRDYGMGGDAASIYGGGGGGSEWPGPGSLGSIAPPAGGVGGGMYLPEPLDTSKYGLTNMTADDAWPYLKAKLLVVFQGEDLRLPVEDLNRVVTMHIQYCYQRRAPQMMIEDLKDLLSTGFSSLDQALRGTSEDRLIPDLVELWMFTFTSIVPYLQAVFLPLDLEFVGNGTLFSPEQAQEFWGGVRTSMMSSGSPTDGNANSSGKQGHGHNASVGSVGVAPLSTVLDVRRLVLAAYRDAVILPRFDTLRQIFSRLSLEFLPMALQSPPPVPGPIPIAGTNASAGSSFVDREGNPLSSSPAASEPSGLTGFVGGHAGSFSSIGPRPGTAMSLDPSLASFNSTGSTLLGEGGSNPSVGGGGSGTPGAGGNSSGAGQILTAGSRSRAISNVSFGSNLSSAERPYTPGGGGPGGVRDNVEDSKQVTEMVGRMLQCMSVLAGVGVGAGEEEEGNARIAELCRLLKLNWLGRGRTGRNRRGMVGGRVKREREKDKEREGLGMGMGMGIAGFA